MMRSIKSDQRLTRLMSVVLTGTGTASLAGSSATAMRLTDNGTGSYTLTLVTPFARAPEVMITPATDNTTVHLGTVSASAIQIVSEDLAGAAKDAVLHVLIVGSDADAI